MENDIESILIDKAMIERRIDEVAQQIIADYAELADDPGQLNEPGSPPPLPPSITLIPILTGSFIFVADLIRRLPVYMQIKLVSVSSYPGAATRSQTDQFQHDLLSLPSDLSGQHVLLIDDILDSGNTYRHVTRLLKQRGATSLRSCVLLRKQRDASADIEVDYVCFDIPDKFVVGYGLDFNDYYRNLPEICTLRQEVIDAHQQHVV